MRNQRTVLRWGMLAGILLAVIIVPFAIFGASIEEWTTRFLSSSSSRPGLSGLVLCGLLASDIFFPVPSSIVSTACGFILGFWKGTLASWIGMCISCLLGYFLATGVRRPIATRLLGERETRRLQAMSSRYGDWVIILARPVPVLAEASVLLAGLGRMDLRRFVLLSALSNAGISAVYSAVGHFSSGIHSFLAALAGSVILPWIFMLIAKATYPTMPRGITNRNEDTVQ